MFELTSDEQVEAELGKRLRRRRVERGLNQSELATKAGVARRTISSVENGEGCTMATFIALMRGLGDVAQLEALLPDPGISPIALTSATKVKERKYPYKPRGARTKTEWKWGDEK